MPNFKIQYSRWSIARYISIIILGYFLSFICIYWLIFIYNLYFLIIFLMQLFWIFFGRWTRKCFLSNTITDYLSFAHISILLLLLILCLKRSCSSLVHFFISLSLMLIFWSLNGWFAFLMQLLIFRSLIFYHLLFVERRR